MELARGVRLLVLDPAANTPPAQWCLVLQMRPAPVGAAPAIAAAAPIATPALGVGAGARREELMDGQAEKVGDAVEVLHPHAPVGLQDLAEPGFVTLHPKRQVPLLLPTSRKQRPDVVEEEMVGAHVVRSS